MELAEEQALSRWLRDVARYPSPAHLRAQVAQQLEGRPWTVIPRLVTWRWLAASAVVLLAVAASALVLTRRDPLLAFIPEATRNHREMVMQHELFGFPDVGPWGSADLPRLLSEQLGLPVTSLFLGDAELVLMAARPLLVRDRKGMVLLYADRHGWVSSLVLVAAPGVEIPKGSRLQFGTFRPYYTQADSLRVLVWKQGEMACFLVVRAGDQQLADLFLKIRRAM
jgi:hypothetical protein